MQIWRDKAPYTVARSKMVDNLLSGRESYSCGGSYAQVKSGREFISSGLLN